MNKEKFYQNAKELLIKIEEKLQSGNYLILFQSEVIKNSKLFRYNDEDHSIDFIESDNFFIEVVARDGLTNSITSVSKLKKWLKENFSFIDKKHVKSSF